MSEIYKEIKTTYGGSDFRLATKEEIADSKAAHKNGKCDGGFCTGVFYDQPAYAWDVRRCAICDIMIGLV